MKNEIGNVYSKLTVVEFAYSKKGHANWKCICECGNTTVADGSNLRSGHTTSCGCDRWKKKYETEEELKSATRERARKYYYEHQEERKQKHKEYMHDRFGYTGEQHRKWDGLSVSDKRLYSIWNGMKSRCENSKNGKYSVYGGRGIKLCEEWHDFFVFREWAYNNGYTEESTEFKNKLSIDRIDPNGNYCPDNCQWLTFSENSRKGIIQRQCDLKSEEKSLTWAEHSE